MELKDKRVSTLIKLFIGYLFVLILATIGYDKIPILISYSLWGQDSFYAGFITNMYNSALDFLVFSIILFVFLGRHDKNDKIQLYKDNIDDCRFWYSEEAAFKNAGNIRRLQELGVNKFDLSKSTLLNTKLKNTKFVYTQLMGACLDGSNFDESLFEQCNFQGASAKKASFNQAKFFDCNFKYINLTETKLKSCEFTNCDFTKSTLQKGIFHASIFKNCVFQHADLRDSTFERADLRSAMELTSNQLLSCNSIKYAKLVLSLAAEINAINPKLLKR
jgi:hypothetical protein